ncbi:hypothetical protein BDD43_4643 [Mucilaginibacter gracilis]|uniref:Mobilization protein MobC n=1 Tax=Mucilaginibacter gracilis TaxID=423350 RepID=A0A495J7M2_9SPHI|nr:mobilization protein [Mucilaginibacter gracilis]RKR84408.1 hypothetical protein BDD43_4643 [Mucilaginibacter gracilis]
MEQQEVNLKNKGGRPKKAVKRNQLMAIKCTLYERRAIEARAKSVNLSVSEYLRELGLTGKIDSRNKTLPPEVLTLKAELKHLGSNMNQVAKKRNSGDELTPLERADLMVNSRRINALADQIKSYLQ